MCFEEYYLHKVIKLWERNMEQKLQKKSSTKLEQTRQQGVKTLIVLFVVGVAVFLGFSPLFEHVNDKNFPLTNKTKSFLIFHF